MKITLALSIYKDDENNVRVVQSAEFLYMDMADKAEVLEMAIDELRDIYAAKNKKTPS